MYIILFLIVILFSIWNALVIKWYLTKNNTLNTVETPYLTAESTGIVTIKLKNTSTAKAYLNVLEIREKL